MTDTNIQNGSETPNTAGVLNSIKKRIGFEPDYTVFDQDLLVSINTAFFNLRQLGVGPDKGFRISSSSDGWDGFVSQENPSFDAVKDYVYLKVRLAFDPPATSFAIDAIKGQISELEYRLNVEFDTEVPSAEPTEL